MLSEFVKTADWKSEKHVPLIECPDEVAAGEAFDITVSVGKEIAHPNTTAHFIAWIALHYVPEGSKTSIELARCEFSAHGAQNATAVTRLDGGAALSLLSSTTLGGVTSALPASFNLVGGTFESTAGATNATQFLRLKLAVPDVW